MDEKLITDWVLIWLACSEYDGNQSLSFMAGRLMDKYVELQYTAFDDDFKIIIDKMVEEKQIESFNSETLVNYNGSIFPVIETKYKLGDSGKAHVNFMLRKIDMEMYKTSSIDFINAILKYIPQYSPFEEETFCAVYVHKSDEVVPSWVRSNPNRITKAFFYLIDYGYARWRNDIKYAHTPNILYLELTDKGRKLQEKTSIERYKHWEQEEKERTNRIEKENEEVRKANIISAQIAQRLYWTNWCIALATGVAAIYYVYSMLDYFEHHSLNLRYLEYFLIGLLSGLSLLFPIAILLKRRGNNKKT